MTEQVRTEGERLFERYLDFMKYSYEFEKTYPGRSKRPDYTINASQIVLSDVKDFDPFSPGLGVQQVDVHFRLREKIQAGKKKFKEYKDFPCCVVLHNEGNPHVMTTDPAIVLGCMYGTLAFHVPVFVGDGPAPAPRDIPQAHWGFTGDAQMTATKNTTTSALLSVRDVAVGILRVRRILAESNGISYEEAMQIAGQRYENFDYDERQPGIIVWENAFAKLPVSRDVFNGPYDERWGYNDGNIERIFCGQAMAKIETD